LGAIPTKTKGTIRELLSRRELAAARHRRALGRQLGLAETEMLALAHLAQHGEMTPSDLGDVLGLSSGGVTALIHRLESAGHAVRMPNPRDGRSRLVRLSDEIVQRAEQKNRPLVEALQKLTAELDGRGLHVVLQFLTRVVEVTETQADVMHARLSCEGDIEGAPPVPGLWG